MSTNQATERHREIAREPQEYESLPRRITAVQFDPDCKPWPLNVLQLAYVEPDTYVVWNPLHASKIGIKPGDYVRVDDPNDTYPIDRKKFEETYRLARHDLPATATGEGVSEPEAEERALLLIHACRGLQNDRLRAFIDQGGIGKVMEKLARDAAAPPAEGREGELRH